MIKKIQAYILLFFIAIVCNNSLAQESEISEKISDCHGAVSILEPGSFSTQFSGKSGKYKEFSAYPSLKEQEEKNSIWASFIAPHDGTFFIDATIKESDLHMIIFKSVGSDICGEIQRGIAEIQRTVTAKIGQDLGLSYEVDATHLYPISLSKGETILICFNANSKTKSIVHTTVDFEPVKIENGEAIESKLIDQRKTVNDKSLRIELRDADTGNPLIGKVTLTGIKDITLQYTGSDFLFSIEKIGRILLKVDASGYFFVDREEPISSIGDHEIVIYLEKLEPGKQLDIEGIEFHPGTSEFMPSADVKLKRLKDFLALNSVIKVEIGGHVQAIGDNTFAAQKLSEARAKRVVNYLVENGIVKDRMTWRGYGNEKPIYPEPKLEWQEQVNRRVEVTIL
jgi:outer membrane protein OmpA-like peptidoglycan-associated protein